MSRRAELLRRAAQCYERAGPVYFEEAAACFDACSDHWQVGRLLERRAGEQGDGSQDLLARAAAAYELGERWRSAALCHQRLGAVLDEARCWRSDGDFLRAAWCYAAAHGRGRDARECLEEARRRADEMESGRGRGAHYRREDAAAAMRAQIDVVDRLIEARLLVLLDPPQARRRLREAIERLLSDRRRDWRFDMLCAWSIALGEDLGRPDLVAVVEAARSDRRLRNEAAWTPTRRETLSEAWLEGAALDAIAATLGDVSTDDVLSEARRLGLPAREQDR